MRRITFDQLIHQRQIANFLNGRFLPSNYQHKQQNEQRDHCQRRKQFDMLKLIHCNAYNCKN